MDLMSDILMRLNLQGSLYFRTAFTSPWGVDVPSFENVSRFHFAHRGRCLVRVDGQAPVSLDQGDLVIIPHGSSHRLYCDPATEDGALPLDRVVELSGFTGHGALVYAGSDDGPETELVCGHFAFDPNGRHPILEKLPPYIHIRNYGESAGRWMEYTLRAIGTEAGRARMGGDLIALKMSEIIFAQALRTFLDGEGASIPGLAGFADPHLSRALSAIHADPAHNWTLADLAREAGLSRTSFAVRFSDRMGETPMTYLASWRMLLAGQALNQSNSSVAEVAETVGYASEAAFARVFKRQTGLTPAAFRRAS